MTKTFRNLSLVIASTLVFAALVARAGEKRASPHEEVSAALGGPGGKKVTVSYGRPFAKGRAIFGGLVPWGQVWRTGADEATTISVDTDVVIGGLKVPKGTYALFTVPAEKQWTLVLSRNAKQWGAYGYDAKQDLGRAPMTVAAAAAPVEQFTVELAPAGDKQLTLKLSWDKTVASVAIALP